MKFARVIPSVLAVIVCVVAVLRPAGAQDRTKTVLVHYMPWYASKPVSGEWGWHWTMNRFNPEIIDGNGKREIASHDSPLIGPYDSGDDHALECQVLLIKIAGLDGVVIDWYGTAQFRDYAMIHRNTQRVITHLKKAGLQFAICYEDQSVKHMVESGHLPKNEDVAEGSRAMRWLAENCFGDPSYVAINGRPLLMVFGPQYFSKTGLHAIASCCPKLPVLFGLPHLARNAGMDGAFGWLPVSGGRETTRETWLAYLEQLHSHAQAISVVFPGFRDIYKEAGLHDSYGTIDSRDGKTFADTLALALNSRPQVIQIATWNDYGEGTIIEPTVNNGYRYLENAQKALVSRGPFTADDLRLPVQLYQLRKQRSQNSAQTTELQKASDFLFAGKLKEARMLLDAVKGRDEDGGQLGRP